MGIKTKAKRKRGGAGLLNSSAELKQASNNATKAATALKQLESVSAILSKCKYGEGLLFSSKITGGFRNYILENLPTLQFRIQNLNFLF